MTIFDYVRLANVALLTVAVLSLLVWLSDTWAGLSRGRKISMASVRLLLVGGVISSAVKIVKDDPSDASLLIITVGAVGVIVGQWLSRNDKPDATRRAVAHILDHVESNEPCSNPGCIRARIELRNIADGKS